jgi:hypothetical protein
MTRCLVRSEALLTQLLFDQALRVRMKDTIGDETDATVDTPAIQVEDTDSQAEATDVTDDDATKNTSEEGSSQQGIVGKINVLMAQDLDTVVQGEQEMKPVLTSPQVVTWHSLSSTPRRSSSSAWHTSIVSSVGVSTPYLNCC